MGELRIKNKNIVYKGRFVKANLMMITPFISVIHISIWEDSTMGERMAKVSWSILVKN
jgi:hypothetical protein